MRYNEARYNAAEYNLTAFMQLCSESIAESDTATKSVTTIRTESQASADALSDNETMAARLETVSILQRATYGVVYNSAEYDAAMYNRTVDTDELLLRPTKALSDTMGFSDTLGAFSTIKALLDSMSETDLISFTTSPVFIESVFLNEILFRIEISNKALNDTIRVADWLQVERNPQHNDWGN